MKAYSYDFEVIEGRMKGWLDDLHLPLGRAIFVSGPEHNYLKYELSEGWSVFVNISRCHKKNTNCFSHFVFGGVIQKTSPKGPYPTGRDLPGGKASRKLLAAIFARAAIGVASADTEVGGDDDPD